MLSEIKGSSVDTTKNNKVVAPPGLKNVRLDCRGENNQLIIENKYLHDTVIRFIGNNNICIIKSCSHPKSFFGEIQCGHGCSVTIGKDVSVQARVFITTAEQSQVVVGDDCMLSCEIQIRAEDSHAIYDVVTGERVNESKDIIIEDHVWLGYRCTVLQGTHIREGSVVGFGSIVKGNFPNNCAIAGVPAKVVKKNIAWERPHISYSQPIIKTHSSQIKKTEQYWNLTKDDL